MKRLKRKIYYRFCLFVLAILAIIRLTCPNVMHTAEPVAALQSSDTLTVDAALSEPAVAQTPIETEMPVAVQTPAKPKRKYHPIGHTAPYEICFPDVQDTQIVAAKRWGITPLRNRSQLADHMHELVYIGSSPYYVLDKGMTSSLPYLVPRASALVDRIGRNFIDSLYVRGLPMHKVIVSSVLRTTEDVSNLQKTNINAMEGSCHNYGTTVDICYSRYHTMSPPGEKRRVVRDDTLKFVLSQVLRDLRQEGACYVKHEVNQGCFHLTVR